MPKQQKTNEQFMADLMAFSEVGALMQAFVLTAIEKYADACIASGPETFDSPMLYGAAWVKAAREAKRRVQSHLGA